MKKLLAIILSLAMVLSLVACGNSAPAAATEAKEPAQAPAEVQPEAQAPASEEPIELTWWTYYGDANLGYLQTSVDKFNEMQDKYHVTVEFQGNQVECIAKIESTKQENLPDIFNGGVEDVGTFAAADYCKPLQYFVDKDTVGWPELEGTWDGLVASYSDPDGNLIGYPNGYSYYCIWYNATMFKEAGIDPNTLTSFEDLYEVSKALVDGGYCTYGIGFHPVGYYVNGALTREGIKAYNNDNGWTGERITECLYSEDTAAYDALHTMLEVYQKMSAEKLMVPYGANWQNEVLPMMSENDCAMVMVTIAGATKVIAAAGDKWEVGVMPMLSCTKEGRLTSEPAGGTGIYVANTGDEERMQGAYEFIKFMSEADQAAHFAVSTGYLAPNSQAYESEMYQEFMKNVLPAVEGIYDSLENANESGFYPYIPICNEMVTNNLLMVQTVCNDPNADIDAAIKTAEDSIQEAVDMYNLANP